MAGTVSVIIPVYNAGSHLATCLDSILGQTYRDLDVVVVDDGSTDGSQQLIRTYAARDPRIQVVVQPNRGVSAARNAGLDAARGEYVNFVDADDWLEEETYSVLVDCVEKHQSDYVSFGYFVDSPGSSKGYHIPGRYIDASDPESGLSLILETRNRFACTRVFTRSIIGNVRFREDLHWGEDTVFVVEAIRHARSTAVVAEPLYHYVQSDGSATRSSFNPKRLSGLRMTEVLEDLVRDGYPQFAANVLRTRVNIIGVLFQDLYLNGESAPQDAARGLRATIRGELGRVWTSKDVPLQTKAKATLMAVSPGAFVAVHRLGLAVRRG